MSLPSACITKIPARAYIDVHPTLATAIWFPSGDQIGTPVAPMTRQGPRPGVTSLPIGVTSLIPPQRETSAIVVPSGDHAGAAASRASRVRLAPSESTA